MKEKIILLFIGLLVFQGSYSQPAEVSRHSWADSVLHQMSLDEKIGQLFMIAAYSNKNENYENELEKQIRQYHVGGLIFFQGKPTQQIKLTNRYQKAAKYPLMIGMDAEHGVGWRLETAMEFPKMLTNGAIRKDSLIYALGATIARHCQELGVHVNFAPVVDINSNPPEPDHRNAFFRRRPGGGYPKSDLICLRLFESKRASRHQTLSGAWRYRYRFSPYPACHPTFPPTPRLCRTLSLPASDRSRHSGGYGLPSGG